MKRSDHKYPGSWYLPQLLLVHCPYPLDQRHVNYMASDHKVLNVFFLELSWPVEPAQPMPRAGPRVGESTPLTASSSPQPLMDGICRTSTPALSPLGCGNSEHILYGLRAPEFDAPPVTHRVSHWTLCWLLSLLGLTLSLPTPHCPMSLGIRSQLYVTPKVQIFPQHQADNHPPAPLYIAGPQRQGVERDL